MNFIKGHRQARRDAANETRPHCHGPSLECTTPHCRARLEAYEADLDARDAQLAAKLGIKTATFASWRIDHDLPARASAPAYALHRPKRSYTPPEEAARRRAAYDNHPDWPDEQLAAHLGITRDQFRRFRFQNGLPPHRRKGERRGETRLSTAEEARRFATYNQLRGRTVEAEAARALGLSKCAYSMWRRHRGLPRTSTTGVPGVRSLRVSHVSDALQETIRRLEAYLSTTSDAKAAEKLGISPKVYQYWRPNAGLPSPRALRCDTVAQGNARQLLNSAKLELHRRNLADLATPIRALPRPAEPARASP